MENKSLEEKNFKELVSSKLWGLLGMILLGILFGYMVYSSQAKEGNPQISYMITIIGVCALIGFISFLVKVIPAYKRLKKQRNEGKTE